MELRSAEGTIQELLVVYDTNIRGSTSVAQWAAANPNHPQQQQHHPELLVPAIPRELVPASWVELVSKANTTNTNADAAAEKGTETDALVQSLSTTQTVLASQTLKATVFKLQKRLYELDPVTEKARYGPKSQNRVKVLMGQYNFLCAQYLVHSIDSSEQHQQQLKHYHQQQLLLQQQRQAQRRREHSQNMQKQKETEQEELERKQEEEKEGNNEENKDTTEKQEIEVPKEETLPYTLAVNRNPDGSIRMDAIKQTCTTNNTIPYYVSVIEEDDNTKKNPKVASSSSPTSLFFQQVQQHYEHKKQTQQQQEELEHTAKLQREQEIQLRLEEEQRKEKGMKEEQLRLQQEAEARKKQRLHDQAERVRVQRREEDERRKQAERDWLQDIQKGLPGVQYYLDILLQRRTVDEEESAEVTTPAINDDSNNGTTETTTNTNTSTGSTSNSTSSVDPIRVKAVRSLCTLFEQIQKYPEEVNNRKIKLTNTNFQTDVGRHYGGIQLLIAAGFLPTMVTVPVLVVPVSQTPPSASATENNSGSSSSGAAMNNNNNSIDDDEEEQQEEPTLSSTTVAAVAAAGAAAAAIDNNADPDNTTNNIAFLISKEPNLEHDMDGWMIWFDLNKATLELLQHELAAIDKKPKK